ncbi:hypothetical protein N0A02_23660 [Paraburkholderia acidicola]|uniref:Sel1 repeat-containing protein n=1 Tax=Paraburkholderia acidicola TaxID=1912599 RepID=A0ABV1LT37_9BURK
MENTTLLYRDLPLAPIYAWYIVIKARVRINSQTDNSHRPPLEYGRPNAEWTSFNAPQVAAYCVGNSSEKPVRQYFPKVRRNSTGFSYFRNTYMRKNVGRVFVWAMLVFSIGAYNLCQAKDSSTHSCASDAKLLRSIGTSQDVETMISLRSDANTPGSDPFSLGVADFRGKNGRRDPTRALHHFETAAARGDVEATFITGYMYARGDGVTPNYCKAEYWYCAAGAQGIEEAKYALRARCSRFGFGSVSR